MLVSASAPVVAEPETGLDPAHAFEAVHDVALLDDQVKVELLPVLTVVGLAEIDTVGAGAGGAEATLTVTAIVAVPPDPEHVNRYVEPEVKAVVGSEPDTAFDPDHAPDAAHEVAPVLDHVNTDVDPLVTAAGFAENESVGAGTDGVADTFTVTALVTVPPLPEHVNEYELVAASAPLD